MLKMVVEPPQTFDVDGPVVHPNALQHVAGPGGLLAEKVDLVYQVDYVAHFPVPFVSQADGRDAVP
jgi:hypothetical protein